MHLSRHKCMGVVHLRHVAKDQTKNGWDALHSVLINDQYTMHANWVNVETWIDNVKTWIDNVKTWIDNVKTWIDIVETWIDNVETLINKC